MHWIEVTKAAANDTDSFGLASVPIREFQVNSNLQVTVTGFINPTLLIRSVTVSGQVSRNSRDTTSHCVLPFALASVLGNCFGSRRKTA